MARRPATRAAAAHPRPRERILLVSALLVGGAWWLFQWELGAGATLAEARTAASTLSSPSRCSTCSPAAPWSGPARRVGLFSNRWIVVGVTVQVIGQLALTYLPAMNKLFHTAPISGGTWAAGPRPRRRGVGRGGRRQAPASRGCCERTDGLAKAGRKSRRAVASGRRGRLGGRRRIKAGVTTTRGQHMSTQGTIVVGVDGSDCSRAALEFALEEAVRRQSALRVVSALPEAEYWATASGMSPSLLEELSADVEKVTREMVEDVVRERGGAVADVPVEVRALGGLPGHVLVDQSRDADLLVVGHRGRGGFRSAVLGSVGLQCVLHAPVPVTVVRPQQQPAAAGDGRAATRTTA